MIFQISNKQYQSIEKQYEKYIHAKGYKITGGNMYLTCVNEFLYWLEGYGVTNVKKITTAIMVEYIEYLSTREKFRGEGTLSQRMIDIHLFSLRILFDYLLESNIVTSTVSIPKFFKSEGRKRNILSMDEVKLLYAHTENNLEKAILTVAYGCGLRRNELHRLNLQDVILSKGILQVITGKGNKSREVPMSDTIVTYLREYVTTDRVERLKRTTQLEKAFFVNSQGKRMSGDLLNRTLKKIIQRTDNPSINSKDITLHCLRHSIATHLIENGASMEFVRDFLGHALVDTVHIYAKRRKIRQKYTL
ncbi:tyrosine-type recombinase/integrase [Parvicella tangerina]|uniref:Tyrosine recombinase XerC n=1 Tax=Parvicella tangerina TaxID=2829795 RepID=A0A916JMA0_9FLAO|nr:tyrosine-type recombinase/integrase [Parvicella tangerina]CAG5081263.1 Tyrosine recombinase XerC [Parvicella tangerina]